MIKTILLDAEDFGLLVEGGSWFIQLPDDEDARFHWNRPGLVLVRADGCTETLLCRLEHSWGEQWELIVVTEGLA